MRIAVALCTFNGGVHLREQLRSIVDQSMAPHELVVTDDASTDDTMAILEQELRDVPFRVDCVRNEVTKGVVSNFAFTLPRCTADVIALSDQDDVWSRDRLARGAAPFARAGVTATFSDADLIHGRGPDRSSPHLTHRLSSKLWRDSSHFFDESGRSSLWSAHGVGRLARRRLTAGDAWGQLLRWNCVTGATLMVRREVLGAALPVPPHTLHDEWLALIAAGLGEVVAVEERLVSYRVHSGSALGLPPRRRSQLLAERRRDALTRGREAERFAELARRLSAAGAEERATEAAAKARLAAQRAALAAQPHRRAVPVATALLRGRYHRLAHGFRSAAHDLAFGP